METEALVSLQQFAENSVEIGQLLANICRYLKTDVVIIL